MQVYDRLQLKRKHQDVGDSNGFYLNVPYNSKRPSFELQKQVDCSETAYSHGSEFLQAINQKSFTSSPLNFEEEMSIGAPMSTESDIRGVETIYQREVCEVKDAENPAIISFHQTNHDIRPLAANQTAMNQTLPLVKKDSPVKGQDCGECLAGKSGHFHHIGRWKLLDSPSGFCQI